MKNKLATLFLSAAAIGFAAANQGLYYIGSEAQESMPLKWVIGLDSTYDSNVAPGMSPEDSAWSITPYVGASFVSMTPQTTWDVYARVGLIYYFDEPSNMDDTFTQARVGVNLTHRFNERLRLSSRNFLSYELEPDYSQGVATTRALGEYLYWQTDNSLGYRWSERLASYTGFSFTQLDYQDSSNQDRNTWCLYHQFRYQLNPQQSVLTFSYRYANTDAGGVASDSTTQYLLVGLEHRFSPNTIMIANAGAQLHDVDNGSNTTSPYAELTLRSQVNEALMVRAFARYGLEAYDTVQWVGAGLYDFDQREVLRIGLSGEYALSPMFSVYSGIDLILANMDDGRQIGGPLTAGGLSQDLFNIYVGVSMKINDQFYTTLTYNYTDSSSDFINQDYDRSRVSLGVRYEF
ncbi:MAG: hypothetical protein K9N23_05430 [Akkermansiaceae bacterium]|nr:hypothetical protein [Akkermansiaceae bacterium]MCF7731105.1 hypothetical protein [Akkermansiaceae bacterium]